MTDSQIKKMSGTGIEAKVFLQKTLASITLGNSVCDIFITPAWPPFN
jgi:hypothetical protein